MTDPGPLGAAVADLASPGGAAVTGQVSDLAAAEALR